MPSLILDPSDKSTQTKFSRSNQFIYHFVRQEFPLLDTEETNRDSLSSSSSLEHYFKNGDYVVSPHFLLSNFHSEFPLLWIAHLDLILAEGYI